MGEIIPFPVLKIYSETLRTNERSFLIRGLEVGQIIPFPVWIIPFPVLKINFEPLRTNKKHFIKEVF